MRRELLAALALALAVAGAAWLLGASRRSAGVDRDPRASTLLNGPAGARGTALVLEALGTRVVALRRPYGEATPLPAGARVLLLAPESQVVGPAAARLAALRTRAPLVLVGPTLGPVMRCLGWRVRRVRGDSAAILPGTLAAGQRPAPHGAWRLEAHDSTTIVLPGNPTDESDARCRVPSPAGTDTLLRLADGHPVAVRLHFAAAPSVTLVAEPELFRNRTVRGTAAAGYVPQLVAADTATGPLLVDETLHGFGEGRGLVSTAAAWAIGSGTGLALVHLLLVAAAALVVRGRRLGPSRELAEPSRRSTAEHVRALATALAAARGRRTAVLLLVRGLRRRLGDTGRGRDDAAWLAHAAQSARTPAAASAFATLAALQAAPDDAAVLAAARAADVVRHETLT